MTGRSLLSCLTAGLVVASAPAADVSRSEHPERAVNGHALEREDWGLVVILTNFRKPLKGE